MSVLSVTSGASDAHARRKHVTPSETSTSTTTNNDEPRYSDIVVDGNSGAILHATNPDALRHPASLTKIMTLYLLFEQLESGKVKIDSSFDVSEHAAVQSPTKLGLRDGQTIKVEDAIKGIVTRSANDAAVVVAENIGGDEESFAKLMTRKAQSLGMVHTVYRNASGLPNDEQITTARDQALLGRAIQERFPHYYKYFSTRTFEYHGESIGNHNRLLGSVEGVDGIKTGYISASGFNIVTSVHRDNRYLLAVVFGGSSAGSRDDRMRELIRDHIAEASVQRGAPLVADAGDAKSETKSETKPGSRSASQTYSVAAAGSVPVALTPSKSDPKAQAKPETKSAAQGYAMASAGSVPVTLTPSKSDPKSQTKPEAKSAVQGFAAQGFVMASADSVPITLTSKSDPGASTTVQVPRWAATNSAPAQRAAPAVGSEDPIHPVMVKTVMVKAGSAVQAAALAPLQLPAAAETPAASAAPPASAPALPTAPMTAAPAAAASAPVRAAVLPFPPPGTRPGPIGGLPSHITTGSTATPVAEAMPISAPVTASPSTTPVAPTATPVAAPATHNSAPAHTGWIIQVGAFPAEGEAKQRLSTVQSKASHFLASADAFTETVSKGESTLYRARFAGLGKEQAEAACNYLKHNDVDCMTIKN
jgi:D-alanyl-D-alanine carboxypeptidase